MINIYTLVSYLIFFRKFFINRKWNVHLRDSEDELRFAVCAQTGLRYKFKKFKFLNPPPFLKIDIPLPPMSSVLDIGY